MLAAGPISPPASPALARSVRRGLSIMDFLLVYPDPPETGGLPFFAATVAEAAARAAASLEPNELVVMNGAAGVSSFLEHRGGRGAILPPGSVAPPADAIGALVAAAGDEPQRLQNTVGQVLALAGTAAALFPALRPSFGETVQALKPAASPAGAIPGHTRVEDPATWSAAIRESQRLTAHHFLRSGVLVEDPETLWADPTASAEPGARIGPSVRLTGNTSVAAGAEIGSFCRLENTRVGPGARILSHSVLLDSSIGRDAKVGPFAHIRPNTRLEPESFAGSFVETKNAVLARRSALPHLSYVGDADVGVRANLGAGTITCNYDGRGKHRTVVEPGAFIGSNAILVAPVTIGRRAFVAAGSVIVEDVPAGALAIARGRQTLKPGRAEGRFEGADEL